MSPAPTSTTPPAESGAMKLSGGAGGVPASMDGGAARGPRDVELHPE
jgi:hypothetical protein